MWVGIVILHTVIYDRAMEGIMEQPMVLLPHDEGRFLLPKILISLMQIDLPSSSMKYLMDTLIR